MRRHQVLCKSLSVVETLGAVSVICSDKTGTLTKNKMYATNVTIGTKTYDVEKFGQEPPSSSANVQLQACSVLCNAAKFVGGDLGGNATDQALLRLGNSIEDVERSTNRWNKVYELDFNSKNKYMASVVEPGVDNHEDVLKALGYDSIEN